MRRHNIFIDSDVKIGENVDIFPFAVLGRIPKRVGKMYRAVEEELFPLEIGDNCIIGSCAVIYRGAKLGRNVFVGDHAWIREKVEIGDESVIGQGVSVNYNTKIGRGTRIMGHTDITGNCIIGDDCWIGLHVITMNDKSFSVDDPHIGPRIGNNVLIGSGSIIFPNVNIGDGAKIGAGAIIKRDIQFNEIVRVGDARENYPQ